MCRDEHALARPDGRGDRVVPGGQHACDRVLEAFGEGYGRQAGIARVADARHRVAGGDRAGWRVITAAPQQHLGVAVFGGGFGLVEALQGAIMAFVEAPVDGGGQPHAVHFVEGQPEGADGAFEHRGIGDIEFEAGLFEHAAGFACFGSAFFSQVDVHPAGEAVFLVPGGFTVTEQYEFVHGRGQSFFRG